MAARPAKNRPAKPQGEGTVAEDVSKTGGPFDVAMVEALVALMSQHDLSEIELRSANPTVPHDLSRNPPYLLITLAGGCYQ